MPVRIKLASASCHKTSIDYIYEYQCAAGVMVQTKATPVKVISGNTCQPASAYGILGPSRTETLRWRDSQGFSFTGIDGGGRAPAIPRKCGRLLMLIVPPTIKPPGKPSCEKGNPIDIVTGAKKERYVDLDISIPVFELPLSFMRYYDSQNLRVGDLGKSWTHNFEVKLSTLGPMAFVFKDPLTLTWKKYSEQQVEDALEILTPTGERLIFEKAGPQYIEFTPYVGSIVTKNADSTFDWRLPGGLVYHFASEGKLLTITDSNGQVVTLTYTGGRLATVKDPTNRVIYTLARNGEGLLTSVTDLTARAVTYSYTNTLLSSVSTLRREIIYYYNTDALLTGVGYGDGGGGGGSWAHVPVFNPNPTSPASCGGTADGCTVVCARLGGGGTVAGAQYPEWYDMQGMHGPVPDLDPVGSGGFSCGVKMIYEGGTLFKPAGAAAGPGEYAQRSHPIATSYEGGSESFTSTPHYDVGRDSDIIVVQNIIGQTSTLTRASAAGRKLPITETNALGQTRQYEYDADGRPIAIIDFDGTRRTVTYDSGGNIASLTDPLGATVHITWDQALQLPLAITDPLGHVSHFVYSATGLPTSLRNSLGRSIDITHDSRGLPTLISDFMGNSASLNHDAFGNITSHTDPAGGETLFSFDSLGRQTSATLPGNKNYAFSYNTRSEITTLTDPMNQAWNFTYRTEDANFTQLQDPNGNATSFSYNNDGRLLAASNAAGQSRTFSYDALGRLATASFPSGRSVTISYDAAGTPVSIISPDDSVSLARDEATNTTITENKDARTESTYDLLGRIIFSRQTDKSDGSSFYVSYTYDAAGNRTGMSTPFGNFAYAYDELNRLTSLTNHKNQVISFTYNDNSMVTGVSYPNGEAISLAYDAASRLTATNAGFAGVTITSQAYQYDATGNLNSLSDADGTHTYSYDLLDRLSGARHPHASKLPLREESYSYDGVGNRTASHLRASYTYNSANRLVSDSSYTYTYDPDGRMIEKTHSSSGAKVQYTYNGIDKLATLLDVVSGRKTEYRYDAQGRRISKTVTLGTARSNSRYYYDGQNIIRLLSETTNTEGIVTTQEFYFTHGPDTDQPLILHAAQDYYYHSDQLGSIIALADSSGSIAERVSYSSFGAPLFISAATGSTHPVSGVPGNIFAFTGREWDGDSDLYYYRSRYYEPEIGRFLQEDQLFSANLYAYVSNNPVNMRDPSGRVSVRDRISMYVQDRFYAGLVERRAQDGNSARGAGEEHAAIVQRVGEATGLPAFAALADYAYEGGAAYAINAIRCGGFDCSTSGAMGKVIQSYIEANRGDMDASNRRLEEAKAEALAPLVGVYRYYEKDDNRTTYNYILKMLCKIR